MRSIALVASPRRGVVSDPVGGVAGVVSGRRGLRLIAAVVCASLGLMAFGGGVSRAALGDVTEYSAGITASSLPRIIAAGPDGNMWFTEGSTNKIGKITPAGVVTEYSEGITQSGYVLGYDLEYNEVWLPVFSSLWGIAAGPDGNMWFTAKSTHPVSGPAGRIGKITPAGVVTEYSTPGSNPVTIAAGSDGNMWFGTEEGKIGKITPAGVVTEYSTSMPNGISRIAQGPDGNVWFTGVNGQKIGKITPAGVVTEYSVGDPAETYGIAAGPDGNMWFTDCAANSIGKITPAGVVTKYSEGITASSCPLGIAAGPDGNMWFGTYDGRIGKVTTAGVVTEYSAGATASTWLWSIAAGPDGNMWFTKPYKNLIATFTLGASDSTAPATPGSFTGVPSSPTNQTGATIGFTLGESDGTVECRLDSGSWGACSSVVGTSGSFAVSGLADGSHTVSVRQTDAANNTSEVGTSSSWTVDTAKPGKPVLSGAPSSTTTATIQNISWGAVSDTSGIARYECSTDGGSYSTCTSPQTRSGIAVGSRSFAVRAVDNAGNVGDAQTASWTVQAPVVAPTVLTPAAGTKTVYRKTVDGKVRWAIRTGLLFSTGGDTRGAAQFLTVQVAVNAQGQPVSTKPSDSQALPTAPTFAQGVVQWSSTGEVTRQTSAAPVWVRVGNRAGKWTAWVKLTQ